MQFLQKLKLPVNPAYKWDGPDDQPEYANPVTLNNRIIELANASLTTAQAIVIYQKRRGELRNDLKAAQDALDDFEQELLVQFPPPPTATKSNRLVQTYLLTTATHHNKRDAYLALRDTVRRLEAQLETVGVKLDTMRTAQAAIQTVADNVQTHLSFVKSERQHGRIA